MAPSDGTGEPVFEDDNPEWSDQDFARAKRADMILPPDVLAAFPNTTFRGSQNATKVAVHLRLSRDVVDHFKAGGPNWQTQIDEVLRKVIGGG